MNQTKGHNFAKITKIESAQKFKASTTKVCSICKDRFYTLSKFTLFCNECKEHSERYRYADWLMA